MTRRPCKCGIVQVRALQAADQFQSVHPAHCQDVGIGLAVGRDWEHRVRYGPERSGDDRLVEVAWSDLTCLPAFPLPQQACVVGVQRLIPGRVGLECSNRVGLAPAAVGAA
jgi:hypothetical protein